MPAWAHRQHTGPFSDPGDRCALGRPGRSVGVRVPGPVPEEKRGNVSHFCGAILTPRRRAHNPQTARQPKAARADRLGSRGTRQEPLGFHISRLRMTSPRPAAACDPSDTLGRRDCRHPRAPCPRDLGGRERLSLRQGFADSPDRSDDPDDHGAERVRRGDRHGRQRATRTFRLTASRAGDSARVGGRLRIPLQRPARVR